MTVDPTIALLRMETDAIDSVFVCREIRWICLISHIHYILWQFATAKCNQLDCVIIVLIFAFIGRKDPHYYRRSSLFFLLLWIHLMSLLLFGSIPKNPSIEIRTFGLYKKKIKYTNERTCNRGLWHMRDVAVFNSYWWYHFWHLFCLRLKTIKLRWSYRQKKLPNYRHFDCANSVFIDDCG